MTDPILDWPEDLSEVVTRSFRLVSRNLSSTALITGEILPAGPTDQRFLVELESPARGEAGWRKASGLIASLRGTGGLVRAFDPARRAPYYNKIVTQTTETWDDSTSFDDGAGWVSGPLPAFVAVAEPAARSARSVVMGAFPASTSAVLRPGDLFEVRPSGVPAAHAHLYEVVRQANSDASGESRVYFEPGLRTGVAAGDMVVLTDPRSVFRLAGDDQGNISVGNTFIGSFGLSLIEVLPRS